MASLAICLIMLILSIADEVQAGRMLRFMNSTDQLISDGIDHVENEPPFINLYSSSSSSSLSSSTDGCVHMYGFFPCADNIGGYILLILVYQYLMVVGDDLVTKGSTRAFNILGTGLYGATAFRIFRVLPGLAMMIISGIFATEEDAQSQVSLGVSVYAGSTIFSLTLLWSVCVMVGCRKETISEASSSSKSSLSENLLVGSRKETMPEASSSSQSSLSENLIPRKTFFENLNDTGITTDVRTCHTAGLMLLSLIPFLIVQLVNAFSSSFSIRMVILIALLVSVTLLLAYFICQFRYPWIQERSLEYSKYENLLAGFLQHVQKHAKEKLIDDAGLPNINVIKRLFTQTDKNNDMRVTIQELESLIHSIQFGKEGIDEKYAISETLKTMDLNDDKIISEEEFIKGFIKWIDEAKKLALAESGDSRARKLWDKVFRSFRKKQDEITKIELLMAKILKHVESQALEAEGLLNDDGSPNEERIKGLFDKFDKDHDKLISHSELEQLIREVKFGKLQLNHDKTVKEVMKEFDKDGNNKIDEEEFAQGMAKWLNKAICVANCQDKRRSIHEFDKVMWEEVDELVYEVERGERVMDKLKTWPFNKSVLQVFLGIAMLTFLSRPLIMSILQLSNALQIHFWLISFVIVPVAMNARKAISVILRPASHKSETIASLTFSEIYGGVIMNNITGLVTLLAIVYAKDLTWDYSAEVLIILLICAMVGIFSSSRTTYPFWTSFVAFFLYPFSLVLFYVLQHIWGWN